VLLKDKDKVHTTVLFKDEDIVPTEAAEPLETDNEI
jgi:hypothetical protein